MKKISLFLVLVLTVFCVPAFFVGCSKSEERNFYKISATFDDKNMSLKCSQHLEYVNSSNNTLSQVDFFLYANTFDEGQKSVPTSYTEKAYPHGESFGRITFDEVKVDGQAVEGNVSEGKNILSVPLLNGLFPQECVTIEMEYEVSLANIRHRLGFNDNTINFGNFFPIACVYEESVGFVNNQFAVNGDPFYSDVSNFEVEITYPAKYTLACSGEMSVAEKSLNYDEKNEDDMNGGGEEVRVEENEANPQSEMKVATCKASNVRDFCFVLSDKFEVISKMAGDVQVNYYFYDDENAESHLDTSAKAVETFEKLFGKYPYQELSVVKAGFCFGGMEYPNLVLIADDLDSSETEDYVIVHEIAHQWWYGIVGNNEFESAWVDEGLTEFSTALFYEENESYGLKYDIIMQNATESYQTFVKAYSKIYGKVDESMNRNLLQFATEPEYVNCTYTKGMLLFDALRSTMSERKFFGCLKDYFKEFSLKNSSAEKLIECFCKSSKINLEGFFKSWIDGTVRVGI